MSLISSVGGGGDPQKGVKRSLPSNPTSIPGALPAFRGKRPTGPDGAIKTPPLQNGNKNNQTTNIPIPFARITPIEFIDPFTGRLAPGDVAFVQRAPVGYLTNAPSISHANVARVVGLDGVNKQLHGVTAFGGWKLGHNVLEVPKADYAPPTGGAAKKRLKKTKERAMYERLLLGVKAGEYDAVSETFSEIDAQDEQYKDNRLNEQWKLPGQTNKHDPSDPAPKTRFNLKTLDEFRLDGIVKSNDEPYSFTSNGSRDGVVFNITISGPTLCNNGYLEYEPTDAPPAGGGTTPIEQRTPRGEPAFSSAYVGLRTVENYPRGSIDGENHVRASMNSDALKNAGMAYGTIDTVATFTNVYSAYPTQCFDRLVQPRNSLYVGLRAYEIVQGTTSIKTLADGQAFDFANNDYYFFQYMPFSSRSAWVRSAINDAAEGIDMTKFDDDTYIIGTREYKALGSRKIPVAEKLKMARRAVSDRYERARELDYGQAYVRDSRRFDVDTDPYDSVRTVDLENMVGAWHVGRVLDCRAAQYPLYYGGPADTAFCLNVDVQVEWMAAHPLDGGNFDVEDASNALNRYKDSRGYSYSSSARDRTKDPENPTDEDCMLQIDQANRMRPGLYRMLQANGFSSQHGVFGVKYISVAHQTAVANAFSIAVFKTQFKKLFDARRQVQPLLLKLQRIAKEAQARKTTLDALTAKSTQVNKELADLQLSIEVFQRQMIEIMEKINEKMTKATAFDAETTQLVDAVTTGDADKQTLRDQRKKLKSQKGLDQAAIDKLTGEYDKSNQNKKNRQAEYGQKLRELASNERGRKAAESVYSTTTTELDSVKQSAEVARYSSSPFGSQIEASQKVVTENTKSPGEIQKATNKLGALMTFVDSYAPKDGIVEFFRDVYPEGLVEYTKRSYTFGIGERFALRSGNRVDALRAIMFNVGQAINNIILKAYSVRFQSTADAAKPDAASWASPFEQLLQLYRQMWNTALANIGVVADFKKNAASFLGLPPSQQLDFGIESLVWVVYGISKNIREMSTLAQQHFGWPEDDVKAFQKAYDSYLGTSKNYLSAVVTAFDQLGSEKDRTGVKDRLPWKKWTSLIKMDEAELPKRFENKDEVVFKGVGNLAAYARKLGNNFYVLPKFEKQPKLLPDHMVLDAELIFEDEDTDPMHVDSLRSSGSVGASASAPAPAPSPGLLQPQSQPQSAPAAPIAAAAAAPVAARAAAPATATATATATAPVAAPALATATATATAVAAPTAGKAGKAVASATAAAAAAAPPATSLSARAAPKARATRDKGKSTVSAVFEEFEELLGQGTKRSATAAERDSDSGAESPTPSSGSDGPKTFKSRRSIGGKP